MIMCLSKISIPLYEHYTQVANTEADTRAKMVI
jgi:hypothetical protein